MFDNDGFLWLGGSDDDVRTILNNDKELTLQRFNGAYFHNIPLPKTVYKKIEVSQIYKRNDGQFYVKLNDRELYLLNPISLSYTKVEIEKYHKNASVLSNVFQFDNEDYILSQFGRSIHFNKLNSDLSLQKLFSFTRSENKFLLDKSTVIIPFKDKVFISDDNFPVVVYSWNGKRLKSFDNSLFIPDEVGAKGKTYIHEVFKFKEDYYAYFFENPQLYIVNPNTLSFDLPKFPNSVTESENLKTFSDSQGNSFITSINKGKLFFKRLTKDGFTDFYSELHPNSDLGIAIYSQNCSQDVWLESYSGTLHHYKFSDKNVANYLADYSIRKIFQQNKEELIIATENNGWFNYDRNNKTVRPYLLTEDGLTIKPYSTRNIIAIDDELWSNGGGHILKINPKNRETKSFRHYPVLCLEKATDTTLVYGTKGYSLMQFNTVTKTHTSLAQTDSLTIYDIEIHNDIVIGATDKGVLEYNLESNEVTLHQNIKNVEDNFFLMTHYTPDEGFLIGSRNGLILSYKPTSKTFNTFYKDDLNAGIATINTQGEDWWINTFDGLVKLNATTKKKQRFTVLDGLSNNEGNRYSSLKIDDTLYVGTIKGLNVIDTKTIFQEPINAKLVQLRQRHYNPKNNDFENSFNREQFLINTTIVLPINQKDLELDFGLTNSVTNPNYNIRYKLNESPWTVQKAYDPIKFNNLAPGEYNLEIEARDFSGNTIGEPLQFKIDSKNVFYKTWWFYLLSSLVVISLLIYFLYLSKQRQKLQQQFSQDLINSRELERTRIAKDLHDSVGQQLTLIKQKSQKENHNEISQMTNNALEEVRSISRNLYPAVLKQLGLKDSIEQLLYDIEHETNMLVYVEVDDLDNFFNEGESLNIYRFIQEGISNSLKHAEAEALSVILKLNNSNMDIKISDNGKGFQKSLNSNNHLSIGLKTLKERIKILGGTVNIQSKKHKGTTIIANVPIRL